MLKYRPEIDGLRALAVIPVILFHAGFAFIPGGFVGVDIFFVISGFLIASILIKDIEKQQFSIVDFYERRARRILPALFLVTLLSVGGAFLLSMPSEFEDFGGALASTSVFSSNIYFYVEADYFDSSAEFKPLLHTWSLAVEEQFYIFFPPALYLMWRLGRRAVTAIFGVVFLVSLALSQWASVTHGTANFYLLPTRAWELMVGVFLALYLTKRPMPFTPAMQNLISAVGLAAIVAANVIYTEDTPFPSVYALLPTLGAGLIILSASERTLAYRLLSQRAVVFIGLISYSAYLWHQPLFAFARQSQIFEISTVEKLVIIALTLGLATLSWRFVEAPFRAKGGFSRKAIFTMSGIGLVLTALIGGAIYSANGFPKRSLVSGLDVQVDGYVYDNSLLQDASWMPLVTLSGASDYRVENNPFDHQDWFGADSDKPTWLIVGNSHSNDFYNILSSSKYAQSANIARFGAQIANIGPGSALFDTPNYQNADIVFVVSRYVVEDVANLERLSGLLVGDGKKVVIIRRQHEFPEYRGGSFNLADVTVQQAVRAGSDLSGEELAAQSNRAYFDHYMTAEPKTLDLEFDALVGSLTAASPQIMTLDRMDFECDRAAQTCYSMDADLQKYYFDYGHLTQTGASFFGNRISEMGWLDFLLPSE